VRDRFIAALLAFFLGSFGVHRFYLGDGAAGCFYLAFSWTGIPQLIAWVEGILFLLMSPEEFNLRYNLGVGATPRVRVNSAVNVRVRRVVIDADGQRHEVVEESHIAPGVVLDEEPRPRRERERERTSRRPEYARRRPRNEEERDRFVLQAAYAHAGVLTPTDLAMEAQFSLGEAKEALEALHRQGVCEVEVDEGGIVRYSFPDLMPAEPSRRMRTDETGSVDAEQRP
jgi:TM2 domain-containing membrane protein YozV